MNQTSTKLVNLVAIKDISMISAFHLVNRCGSLKDPFRAIFNQILVNLWHMDPLIEEEITEPIYEPISVADEESDHPNIE